MYKRARSKNSTGAGGGGEDWGDEELEALVDNYDEDRRTPKMLARQAQNGGQILASSPNDKEGGVEVGLVITKANENSLYNGVELSEIVVEDVGVWEQEGREVSYSPKRAMMRRPLGKVVQGRWKGSGEIEVLHHR